MTTIRNVQDRQAILSRFDRLSPDARPRWGTLNAPRMVTHVTDGLRWGAGDLAVSPKKSPLSHWPLNKLVMFYLPWPKSAPTAPELLDRKPADWKGEIEMLRAAMERFVARDIGGKWPRHVAFGQISGEDWGRLMYRHLDHHLRQFGV